MGDMTLIAMYLKHSYSKNTNEPAFALESEQKLYPYIVPYALIEGTALGVYAAVCKK